jgi:predicted aspartyl protease
MPVPFHFYDRNNNIITDFQAGSPKVKVTVSNEIEPVLTEVLALIDTGSNVTIVRQDFMQRFTPAGEVSMQTGAGFVNATRHVGTVEIVGLGERIGAILVGGPVRHEVILGRDVLQHFRMIYDPLKPEFLLSM